MRAESGRPGAGRGTGTGTRRARGRGGFRGRVTDDVAEEGGLELELLLALLEHARLGAQHGERLVRLRARGRARGRVRASVRVRATSMRRCGLHSGKRRYTSACSG